MIAESGREWWGHTAGSVEKETHTEFLYKILKGIGHLEYVEVRCRLMINRVLKPVCKGADWLHVA